VPNVNEQTLFAEALERTDPGERAAFLDQACHGDPTLRARIERLLTQHEHAGDFLQSPPQALRPTVDESTSERPGTVIGPYKLIEPIGEGGMGTVWMAQQTEPVKRLVALKLIKAGMDSRQVIARFEAERQALALMDHPNIAKVLDGGTTGTGRPYFVMDLVKGVPITRYCDEHQLTPRQRLELFVPVCQAVQHAHQKGIIHRDLKPSNVLVAPYDGKPVPKVIDFGVAKAAGQSLTDKTLVTGFGNIVGTLEYMSPEQAEVNQLDIDTRSDIYSLGVLLYELLAGSPPFSRKELGKAGMMEMLRVIREQEPSKPSTKLSTAEGLPTLAANRGTEPAKLTKLVRGELDWIVMKALEKDRNRRYETANGFAMDVQRYLADEPVQACPPTVGYRLRKLLRRYKGPILAVSLVVLVLLVGIIGTTWGMLRATDAEAKAVKETKGKVAALVTAQQSERDAKDQLFLALWNQARAGRFSRQMGQRLDSLDALAKAAGIRPDDRLRDEAIAALALPDIRLGPSWHARPPGSHEIAFDGQYRLYARANNEEVISIRSISDDQQIQRIQLKPESGISFLGLSPDGQFLAVLDDAFTLRVWRVADGQQLLGDEPRQCCPVAFSPDSRQLAVGQEGWLLCFDLASGREVNRWRLPAKAYALAFHRDNRQLAVAYWSGTSVSIYDSAKGSPVADLPVGPIAQQVLAWHPDGTRLAVAGSDPRIQIWDVSAKRKLATLEGHVQHVTHISFHPNGELLASYSWDGVLRLWDPSTGRPLMQLPLSVHSMQFSPDGRWLGVASHGEQAQLLEVTSVGEYRTLVSSLGAGQGGYYHGDISPDGRLLALEMEDGTRLWDLPSGRELATLPGSPRSVFFDRIGQRWELLTGSEGGLFRWPVKGDDPPGSALRLGPSRQLSPLPRADFARGPEGRTLAAVYQHDAPIQVLDLDRGVVRQQLGVHPQGDGPHALSADGRWLASCGWLSDRVRLWSASTGQMVNEWVLGGPMFVYFTPDSRAVVISRGDEYSFWDVDTLQPIRRLRRDVAGYPGYVAFSPDGQLMALEMAPAVIHLKEVATGRTVARLEDPHGDRARWMGFTPDGTQLVVAAGYAKAIHIWDLRAIRRQLKALGLDWSWPEFPPAAKSDESDPPKVHVVAAEPVATWLDWRQRGSAHLQAGKWDEAVADFSRALQLKPDDPSCWNNRASAYMKLQQYDKVIADLDKAIELDPKNAVIWSNRGRLYLALQQYDKAIADSSTAIEFDPNNAAAWTNRSYAYNAVQQYDKAIADSNKAIELDPKIAPAWNNRGAAYNALHQYDKALADLDKAIELEPKLAAAWNNRGRAYDQLQQYDKAIGDYTRAVELDPKKAPAWSSRGLAYYHLQPYDKALKDLNKAIAINPHYADAHYNLGLVLQRKGLLNEAVAAYKEAIRINPNYTGAYNNAAWLLATAADAKLRNPGDAVKLAQKAVETALKDGNCWNTLGVAHYRAGAWKAAVAAIEKSMELCKGGDANSWFFVAMAHWRLTNKDEARKWYDKAVQWMDKNAKDNEELRRFRSEAEELLEIEKKYRLSGK
jgi:tetratricopeptide (TPR) repeat protein/serine/threonine protein kinase/WD40 repeat protein